MRILDENDQEVFSPDLEKGYLRPDRIVTVHHDAVPAVPSKTHEEERHHENGGVSRWTVVDAPAAPEIPAWDEYEEIQRYILYTPDEIAEREKPSRMDVIESQVTYTAMMTDTMLEV